MELQFNAANELKLYQKERERETSAKERPRSFRIPDSAGDVYPICKSDIEEDLLNTLNSTSSRLNILIYVDILP